MVQIKVDGNGVELDSPELGCVEVGRSKKGDVKVGRVQVKVGKPGLGCVEGVGRSRKEVGRIRKGEVEVRRGGQKKEVDRQNKRGRQKYEDGDKSKKWIGKSNKGYVKRKKQKGTKKVYEGAVAGFNFNYCDRTGVIWQGG